MGKGADAIGLRSAEVHGPHGPRRLFPALRLFSAWQAYLKGAHKHPLLLIHIPTPFSALPNILAAPTERSSFPSARERTRESYVSHSPLSSSHASLIVRRPHASIWRI